MPSQAQGRDYERHENDQQSVGYDQHFAALVFQAPAQEGPRQEPCQENRDDQADLEIDVAIKYLKRKNHQDLAAHCHTAR